MNTRYVYSRWGYALMSAALLLLTLVFGSGLSTAYARDQSDDPAKIRTDYVEITLSPNTQQVAPDGTVTYAIQVRGRKSDTDVSGVEVKLHYAEDQLIPSTTSFDSSKDWVSKIKDGYLTVDFDVLKDKDSRTARISFHVNPQLASGTQIAMRATYKVGYPTDNSDDSLRADTVTIVGATSSAPAPTVNVAVGQVGTTYQFYSNHFAAGEQVVTWLNTPNDVQPLTLRAQANEHGEVWFNLDGKNLAPGAYALVLYGLSNGQTSVAPFVVQ